MLKKILVFLGVVLLLAGLAVAVAAYHLNSTYGWMAAPAVDRESMATPETRLRLVVDTARMARELTPYLPEQLPVPSWIPFDVPGMLPRVVPREVAILGGADFRTNTYRFVLFVNEQRGGPALPTYLNTQSGFRRSFPDVTWDEPGFELVQRGLLRASGHVDLPFGLEGAVREKWPPDAPGDVLKLHGGHLAEGVVDNRNGEVMVLIAALAPMWRTSLEQLQKNSQFQAVEAMLVHILDIRAAVDFKDADSLIIQIRINAEEEIGGQLEIFGPLILTMMAQQIQRQYALEMTSEYAWNAEEHTYLADITLKGVEAPLKNYFLRMFPAPPPAAQ